MEGVIPKTYHTNVTFSPWKVEVMSEYTYVCMRGTGNKDYLIIYILLSSTT